MEEHEVQSIFNQITNCENKACSRDAKHFCRNHKKTLCTICFIAFHTKCVCEGNVDEECIHDGLRFAKTLLKSIHECFEENKEEAKVNDFDLEIRSYCELLESIKQKFMKVIGHRTPSELKSALENLAKFQDSLIESKLFAAYSKFKILSDAIKESQRETNHEFLTLPSCSNDLKEFKSFSDEKIKDIVKNKKKEAYEEIKILLNKEDKHFQNTRTNTDKNTYTKKSLKDILIEEAVKKKEQIINAEIFTSFYKKWFCIKALVDESFCINLNLLSQNSKLFLKELVSAKIRIANIKRINIYNIADSDPILKSFYEHCIPLKVELFCINSLSLSRKGIKMSYYLNALLKSIRWVLKEIYIRCFDISESELQQIVKSSYQVKRLIFRYCDIHCSQTLDFSNSERSNIKFISFDCCGVDDYRKSDLMTNPFCFENIVEAIAKSGIKNSLKTIDIRDCNLNKCDVENLFIKHRLSGVTVVEDGADPKTE